VKNRPPIAGAANRINMKQIKIEAVQQWFTDNAKAVKTADANLSQAIEKKFKMDIQLCIHLGHAERIRKAMPTATRPKREEYFAKWCKSIGRATVTNEVTQGLAMVGETLATLDKFEREVLANKEVKTSVRSFTNWLKGKGGANKSTGKKPETPKGTQPNTKVSVADDDGATSLNVCTTEPDAAILKWMAAGVALAKELNVEFDDFKTMALKSLQESEYELK